ncbi:MAG: hypothetical protein J5517_04930 [Eubacterium sp.]|nr:hypothetical protein [Eubacterium sp.]
MQEKFDERTLRVFPYVIFVMLISLMISMISPIISLMVGGNTSDANLYQMNDSLYMTCYVIAYLAIVWMLSCLYHLSPMTKWFNFSYYMTLAYIISESVCYVLKWTTNVFGRYAFIRIFYFISRFVPTICVMLMLAYILHGISDIYEEMEKKAKCIFIRKLEVFWIAAFVAQIILNIIISTGISTEEYSLVYSTLTIGIYIYNSVVMIILYINVKCFCYEYYLYSYNTMTR